MRTFSALRDKCSYPEILELTRVRYAGQQKALDRGTAFHRAVEQWVKGEQIDMPTDPDVVAWLDRMTSTWTPPPGIRSEFAVGIRPDGSVTDEVDEPEPHVYVARDGSELLTAGRLDLTWDADRVAHVVDVKTGVKYLGSPWSIPQITAQAYCIAMLSMCGGADHVKAGVFYARLGVFDFGATRPIQDAHAIFPRIVRWATQSAAPVISGACLSCYSSKACDAYSKHLAHAGPACENT